MGHGHVSGAGGHRKRELTDEKSSQELPGPAHEEASRLPTAQKDPAPMPGARRGWSHPQTLLSSRCHLLSSPGNPNPRATAPASQARLLLPRGTHHLCHLPKSTSGQEHLRFLEEGGSAGLSNRRTLGKLERTTWTPVWLPPAATETEDNPAVGCGGRHSPPAGGLQTPESSREGRKSRPAGHGWTPSPHPASLPRSSADTSLRL